MTVDMLQRCITNMCLSVESHTPSLRVIKLCTLFNRLRERVISLHVITVYTTMYYVHTDLESVINTEGALSDSVLPHSSPVCRL